MNKRLVIASALAAAVAAPAVISAQAAPAPEPSFKAEKCYGLAKAEPDLQVMVRQYVNIGCPRRLPAPHVDYLIPFRNASIFATSNVALLNASPGS